MKKLLLGTLILVMVVVFPLPTMAGVSVGINISLPPAIAFIAPPQLIVLPNTNVYAVPNVSVDIFFYNGWWWRPWEGRWYRSRNHNSGWSHYRNVPSFYREIPHGWRNNYRQGRWNGHTWNRQPIPHQQVQQNWRGWERSKHWHKQENWGGRDLHPRANSRQPSPRMQQQQNRHDNQPQYKNGKPQHSQKHNGKYLEHEGK